MADFSSKERERLAKRGDAMAGGRFPIRDRADLENAIRAVGRVRPDTDQARAAVRRFILKRARELNLTDLIPPTWAADGSLKN
jgi:hypothetical protein